jgi:hypothetical protein
MWITGWGRTRPFPTSSPSAASALATITGRLDMAAGQQRRQGYLDALTEHTRPIDEALIVAGDFEQDKAYQDVLATAAPPARRNLCRLRQHGAERPARAGRRGFASAP